MFIPYLLAGKRRILGSCSLLSGADDAIRYFSNFAIHRARHTSKLLSSQRHLWSSSDVNGSISTCDLRGLAAMLSATPPLLEFSQALSLELRGFAAHLGHPHL